MAGVKTLYDQDFFAWTRQQAKALRDAARNRSNQPLDWKNLAEEIESLGKSDRRELRSQMNRIIQHLVKLQFSPMRDPRRGWYETIADARTQAELVLNDSPSLKRQLNRIVRDEAGRAVDRALGDLAKFGEIAPGRRVELLAVRYTVDQILGDWFPPEPEPEPPRRRR